MRPPARPRPECRIRHKPGGGGGVFRPESGGLHDAVRAAKAARLSAASVTIPDGLTSRPGSGAKRHSASQQASTVSASAAAKRAPTQTRGPPPNGIYWKRWRPAAPLRPASGPDRTDRDRPTSSRGGGAARARSRRCRRACTSWPPSWSSATACAVEARHRRVEAQRLLEDPAQQRQAVGQVRTLARRQAPLAPPPRLRSWSAGCSDRRNRVQVMALAVVSWPAR